MEPNKSQPPPVGPPPAYSETFGASNFPDNRNPPYHTPPPNFFSPTNAPSINSSVIPILPTAPDYAHNAAIPNYGSTVLIVGNQRPRQLLPAEQTGFICPICNVGLLEKEFTLLGFLLAILLFPFGLVCLFILRKWKCSLCGASMGY